MALNASGLAGTSKLRDLTTGGGVICDICGNDVDSEVADAVALDCSFAQCDPESSCYHTHCLEKFLKSIKCERNRKIGFPCPRGCGKATKFKEACRGKILKSHPVSIRSEANKKRRQAELEQLAQQTAVRDKAARKKEDEGRGTAAAKAATKAKDKGKAGAKAVSIRALNVANTALTSAAPPKTAAQLQKEQLAAAAKNLKNQILARSSSAAGSSGSGGAAKPAPAASGRLSGAGSAGAKREVKTLDEYLAERTGASSALERSSSAASSAAPAASAWGKSRASSAGSLEAAELAEAAAAAAAAAPAAQLAATQSLDSDDAFPPPAAATPAAAPAAAGPGKPPRPPAGPAPGGTLGVWGQKPRAAVVAAPPPPPPRPATAAAAKGKPAVLLVPLEDAKLSRTQRKNQRRAEKKAAAAATADPATGALPPPAAPPSPPTGQPGSPRARDDAAGPPPGAAHGGGGEAPAVPGCGEAAERCLQALVQHKLQHQVEQLTGLGFPPGASLAAVQQHGGNLEAALAALLEQATGVCDQQGGPGLAPPPPPAEVDLSEELQRLQELAARYELAPGAAELLAVEQHGDLDSLAASLAQQSALLAYSGSGLALRQHQAAAGQRTPGDPVSPGGGLFGTLGPAGSEQSCSGDSWGRGTYSAFGFGGFAAAALHAVHGGPSLQGGLLGSMDGGSLGTPTSQDHTAGLGGGAGIWGSSSLSPLTAASTASYGGDAHLLSLLGVSDGPAASSSGSAASSSCHGLLGAFDAQQPGSAAMSSFLSALPSGSSLLQQQHGNGWPSSDDLHQAQQQQPLPGRTLWSGSGGLGGGGVGGGDSSLLVR